MKRWPYKVTDEAGDSYGEFSKMEIASDEAAILSEHRSQTFHVKRNGKILESFGPSRWINEHKRY